MSQHKLTVYHDGSCPLYRLEIGDYRRQVGAESITFVDVADAQTDAHADVKHRDPMSL